MQKVSFLITKPVTIPKTIGIIKYKIGTKLKITSFDSTSFCTNSPPDTTRNLIQLFKTLYSYYTQFMDYNSSNYVNKIKKYEKVNKKEDINKR